MDGGSHGPCEGPLGSMERDLLKDKMVAYYRDIAEDRGRKYLREVSKLSRIIAKARKTEEFLGRYRVLVESFSDAIFMLDEDRRIISCNRAFRGLFQLRKDEIEKRTLRIITRSDDECDRLTAAIDDIIAGNNTSVLPWEFVRKDGSSLTMEVTVSQVRTSLAEDAAPIGGCVAILHDITDRIAREDALRAAEEKYRNIFENAAEGIFQVAADGHYISANPALAGIFGFDSPLQMTGDGDLKTRKTFVNPEDYRRLTGILKTRRSVENFESERYRTDGTRMWTSTNVRIIVNEDNGTHYFEGTVRDITRRKNLESQLRHSQKMEAIGTLAGGVAHDFNNLLTALIGYGNLLQVKMDKDNPLRVYVDHVLSSAKRAANLTNSLLAFSRKQIIDPKPLDVNAAITGTKKLLSRLITEDIVLRTELCAGSLVVMADLVQMDQVLMNLVANARDAMPAGGTLTISTRRTRGIDGKEEGREDRFACISVSDTGIGMDARTREKVFEPFFTTKESGKGTGLGLAIVYGIVEQHNGTIRVASEPGHGTTFEVFLPVVEACPDEEAETTPDSPRGSEKILVVEDNDELRSLLCTVLSEQGYRVFEAVDGLDALETQKQCQADLVILDVVMPKMNGKEAYDRLRSIDPNIRVLFMSGYTDDIIHQKGILDETIEYIAKPILPRDLLKKVREMLDGETPIS